MNTFSTAEKKLSKSQLISHMKISDQFGNIYIKPSKVPIILDHPHFSIKESGIGRLHT